ASRIVGKFRRYLDAHKTVSALGAVVDRPEEVAGHLDVFDGETLEKLRALEALLDELPNALVVVFAAGDGLFEDRGVGRHARNAVFIDQAFQIAGEDFAATNVVLPDALAEFVELLQRIRIHCLFSSPIFPFGGALPGRSAAL